MNKIKSAPAYIALVSMRSEIKSLSYHYEWRDKKSHQIERPICESLFTIFDTLDYFEDC